MLPKEKGGVVDAHLKVSTLLPLPADAKSFVDLYGFKVHGTKNIRVIDLSVLPLLTGVHTQGKCLSIFASIWRSSQHFSPAITYGIAEQGDALPLSFSCS